MPSIKQECPVYKGWNDSNWLMIHRKSSYQPNNELGGSRRVLFYNIWISLLYQMAYLKEK